MECIARAQTLQLNLTGEHGRLGVRNSNEGFFLRPCMKQLFHLTKSAVNQIAKAVQVLTWNKKIWVWFEAIWKKEFDMEVLGLSLFPFKKIGRYVDPPSRIDITECHSRLRWLQNYDIPCSPLHENWKSKFRMNSQNKEVVQQSTDRSFTSIQMVHAHTLANLLRTVIANFVVECILRAKILQCKTLQLHLTGMGRWRGPTKYQEATIAIASAENDWIGSWPFLFQLESWKAKLRKPCRKKVTTGCLKTAWWFLG